MPDVIVMDAAKVAKTREARRRERLRAALPPADTRRWVASRKAAVVMAVNGGVLSEAEAMARYGVSAEELESWRTSLEKYGLGALRTTRSQLYRDD